jgi:hypothetical protein
METNCQVFGYLLKSMNLVTLYKQSTKLSFFAMEQIVTLDCNEFVKSRMTEL